MKNRKQHRESSSTHKTSLHKLRRGDCYAPAPKLPPERHPVDATPSFTISSAKTKLHSTHPAPRFLAINMSVRTMETCEQPPGETRGPDPADLQCQIWWKRLFVKAVLNVITSPYRRAFKLYTWKPLQDLRRADGDRRVFIPLVRDWKLDKYAELQSVQVAVSSSTRAQNAKEYYDT